MTGRREREVSPAGHVIFRLRHSNSSCLRVWVGISAWSRPKSISSVTLHSWDCGQIGLGEWLGECGLTTVRKRESHPCFEASVIAGYVLNSFDWRKRAGIEAYFTPRYWCIEAWGVEARWLIPQKVVSRTAWWSLGYGWDRLWCCTIGMLHRTKPTEETREGFFLISSDKGYGGIGSGWRRKSTLLEDSQVPWLIDRLRRF